MNVSTVKLVAQDSSTDVRPLDALSEVFVHLRDLGNVNTNHVIVVKGCLDAGILEQSVRNAVARVQLLRTKALPGGRVRENAFGNDLTFVHHREYAGVCDCNDASFRHLLMEFSHTHRLEWREQPPVMLLLVTAADKSNSCVYQCTHHAVADARSDTLLLRMIMDEYGVLSSGATRQLPANDSLPFDPLPEIRPDWYRPLQVVLRQLRAFASVLADLVQRDIGLRTSLRDQRWEGRSANPNIGELDFFHSVFPEPQHSRLAPAARKAGVTLNTILFAALTRMLERASGTSTGMIRISCAVSLRRLIDPRYDRSFRNYLVPSKIRIRAGQSAPDLIRSVHQAIDAARGERHLSVELGRLESLLTTLRIRPLHGLARTMINICQGTNAFYSNPGLVEEDFSSFDSNRHPTQQFLVFGCLVPPYDFVLYTPTVNGRMQLDLVYRRAVFADVRKELVEPFLAALDHLLDELEAKHSEAGQS